MQTIILPGSIRSKKNSKIATIVGGVNKPRRAVLLPSKAYTKWEKVARETAREQWDGAPWKGPVGIVVAAHYKGAEPDLSGVLESVGDCLEGICYLNDRQIKSWDGSRTYHDKDNPRTEIYLFEIEYEEMENGDRTET